jgi:hypothetical protein
MGWRYSSVGWNFAQHTKGTGFNVQKHTYTHIKSFEGIRCADKSLNHQPKRHFSYIEKGRQQRCFILITYKDNSKNSLRSMCIVQITTRKLLESPHTNT